MSTPAITTLSVIFFSDFTNQPDLSASSFTFGDGITLHTAQTILDDSESESGAETLEDFKEELREVIRIYGPNVLIAL